MRISDWSSDVCSSDLLYGPGLLSCVLRQRGMDGPAWRRAADRPGRPQSLFQGTDRKARDQCRGVPRGRVQIGGRALYAQRSVAGRSEEHTYDIQSLMRISYDVFCCKKKKIIHNYSTITCINTQTQLPG